MTERQGGMLHYEDGSSASFNFGLDGKEYRTLPGRTVSWTETGQNRWDRVGRIGGRITYRARVVLSEDGKTLTMNFRGTRPDGHAFQAEDVFSRVSGTGGLPGTWRNTQETGSSGGPQIFVISCPAPGVLHYELPDMKVSAEGRVDGSDHPLAGPTLPPGTTISWTRITPKKIKYVMKIRGKADSEGVQAIAADGRSFTDTNWNPGRASEKTTEVYVKQ